MLRSSLFSAIRWRMHEPLSLRDLLSGAAPLAPEVQRRFLALRSLLSAPTLDSREGAPREAQGREDGQRHG